MKRLFLIGALVLGTAATPALAQMDSHRTTTTTTTRSSDAPMRADRTVVRRTTVVHSDRSTHRRWHKRRVCRTVWRNHHRVRRCWSR